MFIPMSYNHDSHTVSIQTPYGIITLPFVFAQDMFIQGTAFTIGVSRRIQEDDIIPVIEEFLRNAKR